VVTIGQAGDDRSGRRAAWPVCSLPVGQL